METTVADPQSSAECQFLSDLHSCHFDSHTCVSAHTHTHHTVELECSSHMPLGATT